MVRLDSERRGRFGPKGCALAGGAAAVRPPGPVGWRRPRRGLGPGLGDRGSEALNRA